MNPKIFVELQARRQFNRSFIMDAMNVIPVEYRETFEKYIEVLRELFYVGIQLPYFLYGDMHYSIMTYIWEYIDFDQTEEGKTREEDFLKAFLSWTEYFLRPSKNIHMIAEEFGFSYELKAYLELTKNILNDHLGHESCECQSFGYFHTQALQSLPLQPDALDFINGIKGQTEISIRKVCNKYKR